jgi:hypothetical protein
MFVMLAMAAEHGPKQLPVLVNLANVQAIMPLDTGCRIFAVGERDEMDVVQTFDLMMELVRQFNIMSHPGQGDILDVR